MEHVPAKPEDVHCCGMGLGNNPHSAEPELRVARSFCEEQLQTHASSEESFGDYYDRTNTPYLIWCCGLKKKLRGKCQALQNQLSGMCGLQLHFERISKYWMLL